MVTRVYGKADGADIIFSWKEGKWKTTIPFNDSGECAVEIYAEDEAGNVGYMCKILFVVTGHALECYLIPREIRAETSTKEYGVQININEFLTSIIQEEICAFPESGRYKMDIEKGGYELEHIICG